MQTRGKRIRAARKRAQLTQEQLAELIGTSQGTISDWERDEYNPLRHQMPKLSEVLDVTVEWLECGPSTTSSGGELTAVSRSVVLAPVIDWVQAGEFADTVDPYPIGHVEKTVAVASTSKTLIALRISGNSMDREFPAGTIIIVDYSKKTLIDGKFYVFRVRGSATFKRWRADPPRLEPHSYDDTHQPIFPKEEVEVVGQVIHAQRDYG